MLPRPSELHSPNFDFEAAVERFHLVVKTHGYSGTSLCFGNYPKTKYNPVGCNVKNQVDEHLINFSKILKKYQNSEDLV